MQKTILWAVVLIVIVGGAFYLMQGTGGTTPTPTPSPVPTPTPTPTAPMTAAITYSADGFGPAEVTIKKGGTVTWTNTSGGNMWVASGPHPAHTGYSSTSLSEHCPDTDGTAFDQCANGASYAFTFDKVGTWPYHNHSASTKFGKVIVVE